MFYGAKNGRIPIGDTDMDYLTFGTGGEALILIPGVGDGFQTARGMAIPFALMYRVFAKRFRVYAISRRNKLEAGFTTRDMAADLHAAMEALGIQKAHLVGVSQGGMIAQYLALDHPASVDRLVLAVSLARPNETVRRVVGNWIEMAQKRDYKGILIDTAEHSYSEAYLKKYRLSYPLLGLMGKPKDFSRFLIQAGACITHDAYDRLGQIACPTLVIGGDSDRIVGAHAASELAEAIPGSVLHLYEGLGHGAYEEARDFNRRVADFLSAAG